MKPTRIHLLRAAIVTVWLILMAWLIRYEAFPEKFTRRLPGYRALFSRDVLVKDSWMKILYNETPIGFAHTNLEVDEFNPGERFLLTSTMTLRMTLMGMEQNITVDTDARLDVLQQLQRFSFQLKTEDYTLRMRALRRNDGRFAVSIHSPAGRQSMTVDIPEDAILYSPMTDLAIRQLKPGRQLRMKTLEPATLTTTDMIIMANQWEQISLQDMPSPVRALALTASYRNMSFRAWMNEDGEILRQETPFGWVLEKTTADGAMAALETARGGAAGDMLRAMAVTVDGTLQNPRTASYVRLRLHGTTPDPKRLASNRQKIEALEPNAIVLTLFPATWHKHPDELPPEQVTEFTATTPAIQADHPDILKLARSITAQAVEPEDKARRIHQWVYENLVKEMTVSMPNALDVLRMMRGDCNEHTYLFVALARAAGIPADIVVGLAWNEDRFYYHAWPTVFVNGWVEMEPTWGDELAGASHLALARGELPEQLTILQALGRLRITVQEEGTP